MTPGVEVRVPDVQDEEGTVLLLRGRLLQLRPVQLPDPGDDAGEGAGRSSPGRELGGRVVVELAPDQGVYVRLLLNLAVLLTILP